MDEWIKYFRLTTLWTSESRKMGNQWRKFRYEKCICDCWNIVWVNRQNLNWKHRWVKSCGCLREEVWIRNKDITIAKHTKHGMSESNEYSIYLWIVSRCTNKNNLSYKNYWGRWIKCLRNNFEDFYKDMWARPGKSYSVDRIDNNAHYCGSNCRWATQKEQSTNTRSNIRYLRKWEHLVLWQIIDKEWLCIDKRIVRRRLKKWRSLEDALLTNSTLYHNKKKWSIWMNL